MNYLIVVAHPDDEVLGAGATIYRLLQNGHSVAVCTMVNHVGARSNISETLPLIFLSKFCSKTFLINKYDKIAQKYNNLDLKQVFIQGNPRYGKWVMEKKWLSELKVLSFENIEFKVPSDYHEYLKRGYGDYMKLPPENNRRAHNFYHIDFEK